MNENGFAEGYAIGRDTGNGNGFGGFGGDNAWWIIILLLFGYGGNRGVGGGNSCGCSSPCATQADVRAAVDQQTLISKIDQQTYGLADSTYALNNAITGGFAGVQQTLCQGFSGVNTAMLQGFHGVDNAVCTLGYQGVQQANALSAQLSDCCCKLETGIERNTTQGVMNTNAIQRQISDCCCDIEKMNMQNRFDAQAYNCNTLQAIDKLGDRILGYLSDEKMQTLRDENQALRLAASQAKQNQYLVNELRPCPIPAYITCNPYAYQYQSNNGCGCGCSGF